MRRSKLTRMRQKAELRAKNVMFLKQVRESKGRASLRVEQDRLHGLLYQQISPALRQQVHRRGYEISKLMP